MRIKRQAEPESPTTPEWVAIGTIILMFWVLYYLFPAK